MLTENTLKDAVNICKAIVTYKQSNGNNMPDNVYQNTIKPLIDNYTLNNSSTPNLLFKSLLDEINDNSKIKSKGFQFYGRKVNNHVWATLYQSELEPTTSLQLYILANNEGIKYGIDYGNYIEDNTHFSIQKVLNTVEIQLQIFNIIQSSQSIKLYNLQPGSPGLPIQGSEIVINDVSQLKDFWAHNSHLIGVIPFQNINQNTGLIIEQDLKTLYSLFENICFQEPSTSTKPTPVINDRCVNKFDQAICVIGDSGVGKSYRVKKTLEFEKHKSLYVIIDSMWQHILFDYSPYERKYCLTKIGEFIRAAYEDPKNNYTVLIDEFHKNIEIINDTLLQAISKERNDGKRFIALNSLVDKEFEFLPLENGYRILPSNLGFIFISSKSAIIQGNEDLKNRIKIVELKPEDQEDENYTIDYLLSKIEKSTSSDYTN